MEHILDLSRTAENRLKKAGFIGTDASLSISLHEYDFILKEETDGDFLLLYYHSDYENTTNNGYPIAYAWFRIGNDQILDAFEAKKDEILEQSELSESDWLELNPVQKIQDIESVCSWFDFNGCYYPMSIGTVLKNLK